MRKAARGRALLFVVRSEDILAIAIFALDEIGFGSLVVAVTAEPT